MRMSFLIIDLINSNCFLQKCCLFHGKVVYISLLPFNSCLDIFAYKDFNKGRRHCVKSLHKRALHFVASFSGITEVN